MCLFLYFGLSFTAERRIIEVRSVTPTIPLSNTYISDTMLKLIREEQELMKQKERGQTGCCRVHPDKTWIVCIL